jgi:hypothetical protein
MYGQRNNVTMLNELPELEDLEGVGESRNQDAKGGPLDYQKYIRNSHTMMSQSGMNRMMDMEQQPPQPLPPSPPPQPFRPQPEVHMTYNCIDIARHIQDCPICSRFYNNDKTVYIIIIIVLSLMCLLLLKKVLNV